MTTWRRSSCSRASLARKLKTSRYAGNVYLPRRHVAALCDFVQRLFRPKRSKVLWSIASGPRGERGIATMPRQLPLHVQKHRRYTNRARYDAVRFVQSRLLRFSTLFGTEINHRSIVTRGSSLVSNAFGQKKFYGYLNAAANCNSPGLCVVIFAEERILSRYKTLHLVRGLRKLEDSNRSPVRDETKLKHVSSRTTKKKS